MRRKVSTLQPTSVHYKAHKICKELKKTGMINPVLKVKTRIVEEYKVSPPCRRCQKIWAISCRKNVEL